MNVASASSQINTSDSSLLPVVGTLLQGLAAHSPKGEGEDEDHRPFRAQMQKIWETVEVYPRMPDALAQAESAVHIWKEYNHRVARQHRRQISELHAIIQLLMDTMEGLSIARPERMQQLKDIAQQMEKAGDADRLQAARLGLADCLDEVRKEALCQFDRAHEDAARDAVTSLRSRTSAERALVEACASTEAVCAVIMHLPRLPLYNRRYGRDIGDRVMHFFADFLSRSFAPAAPYRWTGPTFVLLLPGPVDKVQAHIRRYLEPKLNCDIDTGSRNIMLPIEAAWSVLPMMVDPRLLINRIDAYGS